MELTLSSDWPTALANAGTALVALGWICYMFGADLIRAILVVLQDLVEVVDAHYPDSERRWPQ